jgi:site-specific DNA recombinase
VISRPTTAKPKPKQTIRCAIYTRKSTDEGLDREFNSLDAQREAGEAYVRSQQHEGWSIVPNRYDDGGVSGGTMDRPALQQLLADIRTGLIDVVVVYKVDRFSRSLLDFAKLMALFDEHGVTLVSVTQQFHTGSSMGRLTLNLLLTFAQFEREMISERTRDKMAATRRKGRWCGGRPVLGYDVVERTLVVQPVEADRVRAIFALYLELGGLIATVHELNARGWTTKRWTTRDDQTLGGKPFTKTSLYQLLRNVTYVGQVAYKKEIHQGVHEPIIDRATWDRVQEHLTGNGRDGGARARNPSGALLKGLLFCAACGRAMTPTHCTKRGHIRYTYYACSTNQKQGRRCCPTRPIRLEAIESFVLERIRAIGTDVELQQEVAARIEPERDAQLDSLATEARGLTQDLARQPLDGSSAALRLADIERRMAALEQVEIDHREIADLLSRFDDVWRALEPAERVRIVRFLIQRVEYDAAAGKIDVTFQPLGMQLLQPELSAEVPA